MAIYDTMNLKNKGGAVPTYQSDRGQAVYSEGMGLNARLQNNSGILEQTGAILDKNASLQRQAGEKLAGAGEKLANAIGTYQEKYAEAKASELATQYRIKLQGLMFNEQGTGLLQTQQEKAQGTASAFQDTGNSIMEDLLSDYGNDVRSRFFAKVNDFNISQWEQTKRHEYTEFNKWEINTATAEAQNFGDLAVANSENAELMSSYLAKSADSYKRAYEKAGFTGDMLVRKISGHTSKNISNAIKKTIKNNVGKAEMMLKGAEKYMTQSDINDVGNAILTQRNYLETKALRAENAARVKQEAELRRYTAETKPKINNAVEYAWGTGKIEQGMELVKELRGKGLNEWADALEMEMKSVNETLPIISKLDNMDLPDAMKEYARLVELHNQQKDIAGVSFEDHTSTKNTNIGAAEKMKANAAKLAKIGQGLKARQQAIKQNPSQAALDSGQVLVENYDGTKNWKATFSNMNDWMTRNGVLDVNKKFMTDDFAKQEADNINKNPAPFSYLENMEKEYGAENMPYLIKQMKEQGMLGNIDVPLFRLLDEQTANRLNKFEQEFAKKDGQFRKYTSAVIKNEAETNIGIMSRIFDDNSTLLRSFPQDVRASMLNHGNMLAMMYFDEGKDGQIFRDIDDAANQAFKDLLGGWEGYNINGGNVRLPLFDYDGTKLNPDNIEKSINEYLDAFSKNRDTLFYKLRIGEELQDEKLRPSIEKSARKNLSVMNNNTSDGFWITYKGNIIRDERGYPVSVPKTFKDLNMRDFVTPTDRLPTEGLEHIDMWRK